MQKWDTVSDIGSDGTVMRALDWVSRGLGSSPGSAVDLLYDPGQVTWPFSVPVSHLENEKDNTHFVQCFISLAYLACELSGVGAVFFSPLSAGTVGSWCNSNVDHTISVDASRYYDKTIKKRQNQILN